MSEIVKYKMSFSTGGLFYNESLTILNHFNQSNEKSWAKVRKDAVTENLIQTRTKSSAERRVREIIQRLALLTEKQLQLLSEGTSSEQQYLLWIAVCKKYAFIHDFAVEVIREKFLRMDLSLSIDEYIFFFDSKAEWHEELEYLKKSTQKKLQQVLFRIMREAEIITKEAMIIPALPSADLISEIKTENPNLLKVLPLSDVDLLHS